MAYFSDLFHWQTAAQLMQVWEEYPPAFPTDPSHIEEFNAPPENETDQPPSQQSNDGSPEMGSSEVDGYMEAAYGGDFVEGSYEAEDGEGDAGPYQNSTPPEQAYPQHPAHPYHPYHQQPYQPYPYEQTAERALSRSIWDYQERNANLQCRYPSGAPSLELRGFEGQAAPEVRWEVYPHYPAMQVQHPAVQAYPDSYAPPRKTPTPPEYLDESADDHVEDEEVENSDTDNESKRKRKADSADSPKTSKNGQPKKRQRTTPEQLEVLEKVYEREKLPGLDLRKELAQKLSMTPRRVQVWFQNKRAKEKRMVGGNDFSDFNTPKNTVFL